MKHGSIINSNLSRLFDNPEMGRSAVMVSNHLSNEVMKVLGCDGLMKGICCDLGINITSLHISKR